MTEEQLIEAAHQLAEEEDRVVKGMQMILEAFESYGKRLRASEAVKKTAEEFLDTRVEMTVGLSDVLDKLVDVLRENTVMLNENTERLNHFMTKLDTYLGGGEGLKHVN
jgi:molecular chaperone GrpE (heat shock protein)